MSDKKSDTNTNIKKAEIIKKGKEVEILNPVVSRFGKQTQIRGAEEINPKSTYKPVLDRSGVRGDR